MKALIGVLDSVALIAKQTPAVDNSGSRFGNPAFKSFYDKVKDVSRFSRITIATLTPPTQASPELHSRIPGLPSESILEVSVYFEEAWGSRTRIDYGSGMELNFLCWL